MTQEADYLSYDFVMTISNDITGQQGIDKRCRWCRHVLASSNGPGRPKEFCSQRCRQWDWVSRQRASELALSENELVMTRDELDALKDQIYVLHCALNDVQTDLKSPRQTKETLLEMLGWIIQAAEPIASSSLTPAMRS
jgi:endogenous inhibitor of DNA gyrase (YacG/DUF329 family)